MGILWSIQAKSSVYFCLLTLCTLRKSPFFDWSALSTGCVSNRSIIAKNGCILHPQSVVCVMKKTSQNHLRPKIFEIPSHSNSEKVGNFHCLFGILEIQSAPCLFFWLILEKSANDKWVNDTWNWPTQSQWRALETISSFSVDFANTLSIYPGLMSLIWSLMEIFVEVNPHLYF